ncbi:MAG: hypothetical protein N2560_01605 [Ignavibacteria bacterium]|nr:hypothetical protein [Ignavibacteria bacterium]
MSCKCAIKTEIVPPKPPDIKDNNLFTILDKLSTYYERKYIKTPRIHYWDYSQTLKQIKSDLLRELQNGNSCASTF